MTPKDLRQIESLLNKNVNRIEDRIDKLDDRINKAESNLETQIKGAAEGLKDFIETMFVPKEEFENVEKRVEKLEEELQVS